MFEETGALSYQLLPVAAYSVANGEMVTYGKLYFAEVELLGKLPKLEIAEIKLVTDFPENNLTYPQIQPFLFNKVEEYLKTRS